MIERGKVMAILKEKRWVLLLMVGLLALGLTAGCELVEDEEEGTDLGAAIPDDLQGTWVMFAAQESGSSMIMDISGYYTFEITLDAHTFTITDDYDTYSGAAGYTSGADGDFIVTLEDGTTETFRVEVLTYSDYLAQLWIEDEEMEQLWVMARGGGTIAGVINDTSYEPIALAEITATESFGDETGSAYTGDLGVYAIGGLSTAAYDVEVTADGYEDDIDFVAADPYGPVFASFTLSEGSGGGGTTDGELIIEMYWGDNYDDFDLKGVTPEIDGIVYTISYSSGSLTSVPFVQHGGDETDGPGPEVITFASFYSGTYKIYGSAAWTSDTFEQGGAYCLIKDGDGNTLNTITAGSGDGEYWHIANIDGATQSVSVVNTIVTVAPSSVMLNPVEKRID